MLQPWLAQALLNFRAGPGPDDASPSAAIVSIGNDAGDLDSLVSSIAAANWQPIGTCSRGWPLWVPVAPFPRADFRLRQDACLLFRHVGLEFDDSGAPKDLLHLDEVEADAASRWAAGGLGIALVDHNVCLPGVKAVFGDRVVAIIDHHNDEQCHLVDAGREPAETDALSAMISAKGSPLRVVQPAVGSACSLLAELMDDNFVAAPGEAEGGLSSRSTELLVLMLSAVAIDCRGFAPKLLKEKFVAADVRAAQKLLSALGASVPSRLPPSERSGSEAFELVLQAVHALRGVELPEAARVGGATTIAELSDRLLEARYDVSQLTPLELLRWDYKESVRQVDPTGAMKVGVAAICETMDQFLARSGGASGLEAAMVEASSRRGGLGLLFGFTKEDDSKGGIKGLVALLPAEPDAAAAGEAVLQAIAGVPPLPDALKSNGLFQAQSIEAEGFGIAWATVPGAPRLRISTLRAVTTRKTLMPAVLKLQCKL